MIRPLFAALALALTLSTLFACNGSGGGNGNPDTARIAVGVSLAGAGSVASKTVALDEGKLGPVGCVTLDALADVLPPTGAAVIRGDVGIPDFTGENAIDVCSCVDRYGLPPVEGVSEAIFASIESDLDTLGILTPALVSECKARAWVQTSNAFARSLSDALAEVLTRGSCRVELPGVKPDFTDCD